MIIPRTKSINTMYLTPRISQFPDQQHGLPMLCFKVILILKTPIRSVFEKRMARSKENCFSSSRHICWRRLSKLDDRPQAVDPPGWGKHFSIFPHAYPRSGWSQSSFPCRPTSSSLLRPARDFFANIYPNNDLKYPPQS